MSKIRVDQLENLTTGKVWEVGKATYDVDNISALINTPILSGKETVFVGGYHIKGDGGGGYFYWDANEDKANHNGGTIIDPNIAFPTDWSNTTQQSTWFTAGTGAGCWKRIYKDSVNVKWFGAKNDLNTDSTLSLKFCIDCAGENQKKVFLDGGHYSITDTLLLNESKHVNLIIEGDGSQAGRTLIRQQTENLPIFKVNFGSLSGGSAKSIVFKNFSLVGNSNTQNTSGILIQNLVNKSYIDNVRFGNLKYCIKVTGDSHLGTISNCIFEVSDVGIVAPNDTDLDYVPGGANNFTLINNLFSYCGTPLDLDGGHMWTIIGGDIEAQNGTTYIKSNNNVFQNVRIERNADTTNGWLNVSGDNNKIKTSIHRVGGISGWSIIITGIYNEFDISVGFAERCLYDKNGYNKINIICPNNAYYDSFGMFVVNKKSSFVLNNSECNLLHRSNTNNPKIENYAINRGSSTGKTGTFMPLEIEGVSPFLYNANASVNVEYDISSNKPGTGQGVYIEAHDFAFESPALGDYITTNLVDTITNYEYNAKEWYRAVIIKYVNDFSTFNIVPYAKKFPAYGNSPVAFGLGFVGFGNQVSDHWGSGYKEQATITTKEFYIPRSNYLPLIGQFTTISDLTQYMLPTNLRLFDGSNFKHIFNTSTSIYNGKIIRAQQNGDAILSSFLDAFLFVLSLDEQNPSNYFQGYFTRPDTNSAFSLLPENKIEQNLTFNTSNSVGTVVINNPDSVNLLYIACKIK